MAVHSQFITPQASGAAYLNGVCDWSKVAGSGDLTLPTCTLDVTCFGHNENDLMEFSVSCVR